eukprot:PhM_4_TR17411/c2_g1_i3/m.29501
MISPIWERQDIKNSGEQWIPFPQEVSWALERAYVALYYYTDDDAADANQPPLHETGYNTTVNLQTLRETTTTTHTNTNSMVFVRRRQGCCNYNNNQIPRRPLKDGVVVCWESQHPKSHIWTSYNQQTCEAIEHAFLSFKSDFEFPLEVPPGSGQNQTFKIDFDLGVQKSKAGFVRSVRRRLVLPAELQQEARNTNNNNKNNNINQCILCLDRVSCFAFVPCGHRVLCEECVRTYCDDGVASSATSVFCEMFKDRCPVCRQPFQLVMR